MSWLHRYINFKQYQGVIMMIGIMYKLFCSCFMAIKNFNLNLWYLSKLLYMYSQCWKFPQVRRSEAGNFWGGPGTFCWFFFNFMFIIWDSRQEDLQLFWLSFKHWVQYIPRIMHMPMVLVLWSYQYAIYDIPPNIISNSWNPTHNI